MIIFYLKATGEIIGTINGRVHPEEHLKSFIKPEKTPKKDIGRYIVPFKADFRMVEEEITEMRVVDKKTMRVENVVVGKRMVKKGAGMKPDVPFADLIYDFELGKKRIYDYKMKLNKKGQVEGFIKK